MSEEKLCPQCAETVKSGAKVCRYCGHKFEGDESAASAIAVSGTSKTKKGCLIAVAVLVGLIVLGAILGDPDASDHSGDESAAAAKEDEVLASPALQVTAVELAQAYDNNEAAAQRTYGDKILDVSGMVTGITLDIMDDPVVQLGGINQFQDVQADLAESDHDRAASISKGQQISLRCENVSEVIGTPMLDECRIID